MRAWMKDSPGRQLLVAAPVAFVLLLGIALGLAQTTSSAASLPTTPVNDLAVQRQDQTTPNSIKGLGPVVQWTHRAADQLYGKADQSNQSTVDVEKPSDATQANIPQQEPSTMLSGIVRDATTNQPLVGAVVGDGKSFTITAEDGSFTLKDLAPDAVMRVRMPGYDRAIVDLSQNRPQEVTIRPRNIRALYMTYFGIGNDDLRDHALQLTKETEANALVIDVKGDRGWLAYESSVPLVKEIGAQSEIMMKDPKQFLADMHQQGIYTIARIVTFKDNNLARAHPELAVHDSSTGDLWIDGEGLAWLDPFIEANWDYDIALAVEAAQMGFDEIQFDYVRFPTDPSSSTTVEATAFSQENLMANRVAAIDGFLKKADEALKPYGVALAMDCFGYVTWRTDDMGIGQHLESLAQVVDYICPMVYPTLYWDGIPRMDGGDPYVNDAPAHPFDIVNLSLKQALGRIPGARAQLRPWLQYYNDYIMNIDYGANEINLQKEATYDANIDSWMMWDPSNRYIKGGFVAKE